MRSTPVPPIEDFMALVKPSAKEPLIANEIAKPLPDETKGTLDITFHNSSISTVFKTIRQKVTTTSDGQPYAGGLVLEKAKSKARECLRDGQGNLVAVVVFEGTNFNPRMLLCCPTPFQSGQEECKYKQDGKPLYCWYKVHGHFPRSLRMEVWKPNVGGDGGTYVRYVTEYFSQTHYTKTYCFGIIKSIDALSLKCVEYSRGPRRGPLSHDFIRPVHWPFFGTTLKVT